MLKKFRIVFVSILFLMLMSFQVSANPVINEYVLENGMHVFILEDFSSALIRVEVSCAAGFSSQSPDNAGFFPLYSKLYKYAAPSYKDMLSDVESECNADSSRYYKSVTVSEFGDCLKAMASAAFDPVFPDYELKKELAAAKKEVTENAFSVEGFINSAIDSRVFSDSPWKHDSGIYPTLFSKTNISCCRLLLSQIAEDYYRPKNCALFISGPVTTEQALKNAETAFGKKFAKPGSKEVKNETVVAGSNSSKKLFVLSDQEFSAEMTQIVVQYKGLEMEECDYAATVLNNDSSLFKKRLMESPAISIYSPQYINVAGTHKNNCSRLIFQSLMEIKKTSPFKNVQEFISIMKSSVSDTTDEEFNEAGKYLVNSFNTMLSDSSQTMDLLAQFWALKDYSRANSFESNIMASQFYERPQRLALTKSDSIRQKMREEEPYVFVLLNSTLLKKYRKEFENAGYEIVTIKNGSWYSQALYDNIKKSIESDAGKKDGSLNDDSLLKDYFLEKNTSSITKIDLKNNIPVYMKKKQATNTVTFCLVIDGGELCDDKNNYGLESVIVDSIASKLKGFLYEKLSENLILSYPEVYSRTDLTSSAVYVDCLKEDLCEIIESFSDALIYSDFVPSMVDPIVMQRKSEQIVKTSSAVFQLTSNAIPLLYKSKEFTGPYSLNKDILKKVNFTQILESMTKLFNADRYKIIISGNFDETISDKQTLTDLLNNTFGILSQEGQIQRSVPEEIQGIRKVKRIKLVHLFMTDVSKEKAGPRPQVLIPTTEFLDPAQYWMYNAESENDAIFNALLNDFSAYLQSKCDEVVQTQKMIVINSPVTPYFKFGNITFLNVKSTSSIENIYVNAFGEYLEQISEDQIKRIKSNWVKKYLSKTQTNAGLCLYIKEGIDSDTPNPDKYIKDYEKVMNADVETFRKMFQMFDYNVILRMYSSDTKR